MIVELPVRSDLIHYEFRITLDSIIYIFSFRYNSRLNRWIMDIFDGNGVPLVQGILILVNTSLLGKYSIDGLPQGLLFALNLVNEHENPTRHELGENVLLLYQENP